VRQGQAASASLADGKCESESAASLTTRHLGEKDGKEGVHSDIPEQQGAEEPVSTLAKSHKVRKRVKNSAS